MNEKIILKLLRIIETDRKEMAKEREEHIAVIKDLTDKLYFQIDKQSYMVKRTEDAIEKETKSNGVRTQQGIPLEDLDPDEFEEAIANG